MHDNNVAPFLSDNETKILGVRLCIDKKCYDTIERKHNLTLLRFK